MGIHKKFDYDSDDFYEEIYHLAFQGCTNAEIADGLEDKFGVSLHRDTFSEMKNGRYDRWTEEENRVRSERITRQLERARRKTNSIVRGRFLKVALGGVKTTNTTTIRRRMRINGQLTEDEEIQTTTSECESAPNITALGAWLHHFDKEWRMSEGKVESDYADDPQSIPQDIQNGVDIAQWIDQEVREKNLREEEKGENE